MSIGKEALSAARKTLEAVLSGKPKPIISYSDPIFMQKCGIFVTIKKHGELRGCIGFIQGVEPLGEAIQQMSVAAATQDGRFPPVKFEELDDIELEISVLTPLEEVKDISEIKLGRDGLVLRRGPCSGLLLPQVPLEWNWDLDQFLHNLCLKAGLESGSHKLPDARLEKFSATIYSESKKP